MSADDNKYADARMTLNGAMAEFVIAANGIGKSREEIASDVCDSLFDATEGDIKLDF